MNSGLAVPRKGLPRDKRPGTSVASKVWVLVVDDHEDLLEVTKTLLELQGYCVRAAANAREALDILKADARISVLFSDVVMPDMNGVELAQAALQMAPKLHVVLASGYPGTALEAANACDCDFPLLLKPYSLSELKAALLH